MDLLVLDIISASDFGGDTRELSVEMYRRRGDKYRCCRLRRRATDMSFLEGRPTRGFARRIADGGALRVKLWHQTESEES